MVLLMIVNANTNEELQQDLFLVDKNKSKENIKEWEKNFLTLKI